MRETVADEWVDTQDRPRRVVNHECPGWPRTLTETLAVWIGAQRKHGRRPSPPHELTCWLRRDRGIAGTVHPRHQHRIVRSGALLGELQIDLDWVAGPGDDGTRGAVEHRVRLETDREAVWPDEEGATAAGCDNPHSVGIVRRAFERTDPVRVSAPA